MFLNWCAAVLDSSRCFQTRGQRDSAGRDDAKGRRVEKDAPETEWHLSYHPAVHEFTHVHTHSHLQSAQPDGCSCDKDVLVSQKGRTRIVWGGQKNCFPCQEDSGHGSFVATSKIAFSSVPMSIPMRTLVKELAAKVATASAGRYQTVQWGEVVMGRETRCGEKNHPRSPFRFDKCLVNQERNPGINLKNQFMNSMISGTH